MPGGLSCGVNTMHPFGILTCLALSYSKHSASALAVTFAIAAANSFLAVSKYFISSKNALKSPHTLVMLKDIRFLTIG